MIEKKVIKQSSVVFLIGSIILLWFQDYPLLLGFGLGYIIDVVSFILTVKFTDMILLVQNNTYKLSGLMFLMKLGIYGVGIFVAIQVPHLFHLATIVVGYMVTKITIYITMIKDKGGE